jgi:hypothetical protein
LTCQYPVSAKSGENHENKGKSRSLTNSFILGSTKIGKTGKNPGPS